MAVINSLMPAISRTSGSIVAAADSADARIGTQIEIVHATGANGSPTVTAWVKNTGAIAVGALSKIDLFFGPESGFVRLPYGQPTCTAPCWYYSIENDTAWNPTSTLKITIKWSAALSSGTAYYVKIVTPNGISDSRFFTV